MRTFASTMSWKAAAIVNLFGGLFSGVSTGFFPIALQFNAYLSDCSRFQAQPSCEGSSMVGRCSWDTMTDRCLFPDWNVTYCSLQKNASACLSYNDQCTWTSESCTRQNAWSAFELGLYSAMFVVGATLGSPGANFALKYGRRCALMFIGVLSLFGQILVSVGWAENFYAMQVVGRTLVGIGVGMISVVSPMYCGEMAGQHQSVVGVLFQIGCTFGIMLIAFIGWALDPRDKIGDDPHTQLLFQWVLGVVTLACFSLLPIGFFVPEPKSADATMIAQPAERDPLVQSTGDETEEEEDQLTFTWQRFFVAMIPAIALCGAQQLTGINAVMNYAPTIMKATGMQPLMGNFCIMSWNFVTTLASIPAAKRWSSRVLYIGCAAVASLACLLTGIPTLPGVVSDSTARHWLAGIGIFAFVLAFEVGMGPNFYILSQDIFPIHFRSLGCSSTMGVVFGFNIIINLGYPVLVEAINSSHHSHDPDFGQAIVFFIFGGLGILCILLLVAKMPKSNFEKLQEKEKVNSNPECIS